MAEWRLFRGWPAAGLKARLDALPARLSNFDGDEEQMGDEGGWHHYQSEAVIAIERESGAMFERARLALASYQFSDPRIVIAHFDPESALLRRRLLLEIKVLGLHYLCPAVVNRVRDEPTTYGFRYDTLEGHIERGLEWFLIAKNADGEIRFRIEARWKRGDFPNWWSRVGFALFSGPYQRHWHRQAHRRLSMLAHYGALRPPTRDASGLTHQGVDVVFTYYTKRRRWQ
jgi:uncharacterized protein (UPF0548 family)